VYVQRELEKEIAPFLKRKEIIAIVGPRQVGKTTFLEQLFCQFKKEKRQNF
jgi:predicted AAA+ superfamily ATPase